MADPTDRTGAREEPPVVLITGAAGAIGSALLRRFAASGARTVGTDLPGPGSPTATGPAPADPAPAGPAPAGPSPADLAPADLWIAGDVTVPADMQRAVDDAVATFGRLDVVVAGAGITALGSFADTSDEAFRRVVDVNLHGTVNVTRAALPALRRTGGRIVVLSSVAGFAPVAGRPAYTASKHAVTGLFESLRPEFARDGVGVTLVHPSFLVTSPADQNDPAGAAGARTHTGTLLLPDAVAAAIVGAVARGRDRTFPGRTAKAARVLHRVAPGLYTRVMQRRLAH